MSENWMATRAKRDGLAHLVWLRFKEHGPMSVAECAARLAKPIPHIAPRVTELIECGALEIDFESGRRRAPSGRGRPALVYRAAERAS